MSATDSVALRLHEDPAGFLEAVSATAAATGFDPRLVEKDYFCTVLLQLLAPPDGLLVFKGGTCLAKVHTEFYRLSEDLDFTIPTTGAATRAMRSRLARSLEQRLTEIEDKVPRVRLRRKLEGANNSTHYVAVFGYDSLLGPSEERIQFEVGLREPLLRPIVEGRARTVLLNPASGSSLVPTFRVPSLSFDEAMAEKIRAALCRREVAIRDFYDIDHAVGRMGVRLDDPELLGLVQLKLTLPATRAPDASQARLNLLRPQVETELKPVLRAADFMTFDLERAFAMVVRVAAALA